MNPTPATSAAADARRAAPRSPPPTALPTSTDAALDTPSGTKTTHVPYRGSSPAMQDLIGGRIDYQCDQIVTSKPQIDGGAMKGLAILTEQRSPVLPNLPTAREQGFDIQTYAPRGDRTKKVRSAVNQARRGGLEVREYRPAERRDEAVEAEMREICRLWRQGRRMEHLRSKVRQFGRLIETHLPDHAGIAAKLGIGRHYAIDVSPDFYARRLQRGSGCSH